MRVEERKEGNGWEGGQRNQFPVGMRVLAVDDDPTCLKVLEALLLKCQYHVTTTNAAKTALKMLRENKDGFDLVISDVHMPDMDGFTLLELVGLEMDLPVIMLSGNGERDAVMKGIQHGACDYLLKPVRVEELKNIWQHVIRRRKLDSREHNNLDDGEDSIKPHHSNSEDEQVHNGRANRKRKDQDDEEHNCENKDPATQKKARVVWSVELHRKFVVAVTQLGFERAVPKRILDLMKVEGLTRENVASHLQKFRLYLKRLNAVANQQANIAVTFGVQDPSYLPLTSMDDFGDYHTLSASIPINAHPSFQANRINPDIVGMHGLSPGACCIHNTTNNPTNELNELHHISIPGNQHSHLLQGIPMELEADQSQQLKKIEDKNHFQSSCSAGLTSGRSRKPSVDVTSNSLLPQARLSSVTMPSMATGAFGMGAGVSPQLPDIGRFSETSQSAVPSTGCAANIFPVGASFSHDDLACHNIRSNVTMTNSQIHNNPANVMPSTSIVAPHYPMTGLDVQCQGSLFNGNVMLMQRGTNEDSNYLSFKRVGDSQRNFREPWKDHTSEPIIMFNPCGNPPFPGQSIVDPNVQSHRLNKRMGMNVSGQLNLSTPNPTYNCKLDKSTTDAQLKYKGRYILDNP